MSKHSTTFKKIGGEEGFKKDCFLTTNENKDLVLVETYKVNIHKRKLGTDATINIPQGCVLSMHSPCFDIGLEIDGEAYIL